MKMNRLDRSLFYLLDFLTVKTQCDWRLVSAVGQLLILVQYAQLMKAIDYGCGEAASREGHLPHQFLILSVFLVNVTNILSYLYFAIIIVTVTNQLLWKCFYSLVSICHTFSFFNRTDENEQNFWSSHFALYGFYTGVSNFISWNYKTV